MVKLRERVESNFSLLNHHHHHWFVIIRFPVMISWLHWERRLRTFCLGWHLREKKKGCNCLACLWDCPWFSINTILPRMLHYNIRVVFLWDIATFNFFWALWFYLSATVVTLISLEVWSDAVRLWKVFQSNRKLSFVQLVDLSDSYSSKLNLISNIPRMNIFEIPIDYERVALQWNFVFAECGKTVV